MDTKKIASAYWRMSTLMYKLTLGIPDLSVRVKKWTSEPALCNRNLHVYVVVWILKMYSPLDFMFFISQKTFDWIALMASVL